MTLVKHRQFMQTAYSQALLAKEAGEVPVGAAIINIALNKVISVGHNMNILNNSPICHAEIVAIEKACKLTKSRYLEDCAIYVTLQPCQMCLGAITQARLKVLHYASCSEGEDISVFLKNQTLQVFTGIMEEECTALLKSFFSSKR